ncbi:MAG: D-Ala-D-Ala carboxypeptidase family metallohydrolase, partial [Siculibacillus sp.]
DGGANEDADEERAAPSPPPASAAPQAAPGQILGFFSSPTEPVRAPSTKKIDTPFGVPYVLQTGSVETACLKPELVEILRRIEGKYHQKVVITSGFRDRGRQGSLHRTCAAVDIEVPGVPAEALAAFARTIPGIGGVGTYCYPHLIHVDIGAPRDWKYGCGSFFAMRGAPGKWGKVPSALASAQPAGDAKIDPATLAD